MNNRQTFFDNFSPQYMAEVFAKNTPQELSRLVVSAGFEISHLGEGTAGDWGIRPLNLDEIEMMIIAEKTT